MKCSDGAVFSNLGLKLGDAPPIYNNFPGKPEDLPFFFVAHFLTTDSLVKSSVHIEGNGGCRKALSAEFSPSSRQVSWGGGSLTLPKHRNIMTYSNVFILVYSSKLHVYSIWG